MREEGLGGTLTQSLGFVDAFHETVGLTSPSRSDTVDASSQNLTSLDIAISKQRERMGETLINEEALLFAKYLRDERKAWTPRIASF
jgi:hypothetical protein